MLGTPIGGLTKGFFSGQRLFLIRASGTGDLWFNTFGALVPVDVDGEYVVDTGHIVAFTEGLDYRVASVGGYKSLFFSGEGLVCRFSGRGRVWIQTRRIGAFASWVFPFWPITVSWAHSGGTACWLAQCPSRTPWTLQLSGRATGCATCGLAKKPAAGGQVRLSGPKPHAFGPRQVANSRSCSVQARRRTVRRCQSDECGRQVQQVDMLGTPIGAAH